MTGFEARLGKGKELQDYFINYLKENNINFLLSGYEHQSGSDQAKDKIKRAKDLTSFFVRHYPDTTLISVNKSVLVEIKNSSGIEKDCYDTYLSLCENLSLNVLLFLKNKMLCRVDELKFCKVKEWDYVAEMNIPVIDEVWKAPRQMPDDEYKNYLRGYDRKGKNTSGSTFAFIDFDKTNFYPISVLLNLKA